MKQGSIPESNQSAHSHPEGPGKAENGSAPTSGRGPNGRFCKGNPGGPGNPFARQVGAMRQEFLKAVTSEDIAAIVRAMIDKAKEGDVAAAKLVLQYTMGKPAEAVDPDRLDEMEWQQWQRERVHGAMDVFTGMAAGAACAVARVMVPAVQETKFAEFEKQLDAAKERRARKAARQERRAARRAEREARRAERQSRAEEVAQARSPVEEGMVPTSAAREEPANGGEPAPVVSPVEAQKAGQGGQEQTSAARAAAVATAMRLLEATVNKREETVRRAANESTDRL